MPPRRACDLCYKRKIQCLIKTPGETCDWCKSQHLTCTFDRVIQKDPNKRTTSDVVAELSHRVEELEDALQGILSATSHIGISPSISAGISPWSAASFSDTSQQIPPLAASHATATGQQAARNLLALRDHSQPVSAPPSKPICHLSRCQLGNNWYFKGVGILSPRGRQWISEGAGQRDFLDKFDIFSNNPISNTPQLPPSVLLPHRPRSLPPQAVCKYLFEVFCKSKTSRLFPILDRDLFEGTIARAFNVNTSDAEHQLSAEVCLWAMLALAVRTEETRHVDSVPEANHCVQEVRGLLIVLNGAANLDTLQATLLLWANQKLKGKCREASITFTSACRLVCDLGGHFIRSEVAILPQHIPTLDEQSQFHIRRLFWVCYCFDKDASFRTASPPLLTSDHCDVSGPDVHRNQTARDVNLAKIKEKASRQLCSPRAFKYTESELLGQIRQLDDELEEWRLSIELSRRPRLSVPSAASLPVTSSMSTEDCTHTINLQLDYLFTMINIHTLVRKCGDLERNLPDDLHSVVHSSADLSIEASRSIFRFLDAVVDFWRQDAVWVVSHYAPMAAMPLFLNILIHPLGNTAESDLQILSSISNITRKVPTENLSVEEIECIQETGVFVMELVRLGHSAAWMVKRGEREHDLDIIYDEG